MEVKGLPEEEPATWPSWLYVYWPLPTRQRCKDGIHSCPVLCGVYVALAFTELTRAHAHFKAGRLDRVP